MSFYPCRGGGMKPFDFCIAGTSGDANTNGAISAIAIFPFDFIKRVEIFDLLGNVDSGKITITAYGLSEISTSDVNNKINTATATRTDVSKENPLILDLSSAPKYSYIALYLTGTNWNYEQKAIMTIYPR